MFLPSNNFQSGETIILKVPKKNVEEKYFSIYFEEFHKRSNRQIQRQKNLSFYH